MQLLIYSILIYWVAVNVVTFALFGIDKRHKTLHRKFTWGIPAILIAQLTLAGVIVYYIVT